MREPVGRIELDEPKLARGGTDCGGLGTFVAGHTSIHIVTMSADSAEAREVSISPNPRSPSEIPVGSSVTVCVAPAGARRAKSAEPAVAKAYVPGRRRSRGGGAGGFPSRSLSLQQPPNLRILVRQKRPSTELSSGRRGWREEITILPNARRPKMGNTPTILNRIRTYIDVRVRL